MYIEHYSSGRCYGCGTPIYIYPYELNNGYAASKPYEYFSNGGRHYCAKILARAQKTVESEAVIAK